MSAEITLPVGQQNQNIVRLATAQALAGANSVVFYATGAIVGNAIAPLSDAGHAAHHHFCAGDGGLYFAVWRAGQKTRAQNGFYGPVPAPAC
ncbi:major facilitator superfamily protein [Klebsiella michiganensis]|nr:major facilitator superfamily protein [Klebsiella michiganensis]